MDALYAKICRLIEGEITRLNIPGNMCKIRGDIQIAEGRMLTRAYRHRYDKVIISLGKKGYKVRIGGGWRKQAGGVVRKVKTIEQVNEILDMDTYLKKRDIERTKLIENLRKSGLEELDKIDPMFTQCVSNVVAAFKISETKMIVISGENHFGRHVWFVHKSIGTLFMKIHIEDFDKKFKKFINRPDRSIRG